MTNWWSSWGARQGIARALPLGFAGEEMATLVVLAISLGTGVAWADSGSYTTSDGMHCTWYGSSGVYQISCSGYSYRTSRYIIYNCDYYVYGRSSSEWYCRDLNGGTWHGSQ